MKHQTVRPSRAQTMPMSNSMSQCKCCGHVDILRVMPSKAIELSAFDAYKKLLSHHDEDGQLKRPGPLLTGLAGAAAGRGCLLSMQNMSMCLLTFQACGLSPKLLCIPTVVAVQHLRVLVCAGAKPGHCHVFPVKASASTIY